MLLVTGGAGFIGANFLLHWFAETDEPVVNLDKLTYAGNPRNLVSLNEDSRYVFVRGDICDRALVRGLLERHLPRAIVHFAAESHVDRSIHGPKEFVQTNMVGTFCLLEEARLWREKLPEAERDRFRFLHVSTDEVYGSLGPDDAAFTEASQFSPNSPYSASKAGSDHLVRAYHQTYGVPTLTTNCSNNYGPYQFPEKLIPLVIRNALSGKRIPIYGDGLNIRDWLYVRDHCRAIICVLEKGIAGESYNVGGDAELTNLQMVNAICAILDTLRPMREQPYSSLLEFVKDRPGHDRRYAINSHKIRADLGWAPHESLHSGLLKTVKWYLANDSWVEDVTAGTYRSWMDRNYSGRGVT